MKWNDEDGYIQYKLVLTDLMSRLGIGAVDYHVQPELAPYITKILEYVDKRLLLLGDSADMKEKLQEIFDIFDYGAELIVDLRGLVLAKEVGVADGFDIEIEEDDAGDLDLFDGGELGSEENNEEPEIQIKHIDYSQDRFIFSWTNILTSLVVRLKLMYASLLVEQTPQGCPCCCGSSGETWKDWEAWSGGIYPNDEEYGNDYSLGTTQNYGVKSSTTCTCGYRL